MFNQKHTLGRLADGVIFITSDLQDDPFADGPQVGTGVYEGVVLNSALEARVLLVKEETKERIAKIATEARAFVVAGYDEYERDSWTLKKLESERVMQDSSYVSQMLLDELDERSIEGETVQDLAQIILTNAARINTAYSKIKGMETASKNKVDNASSEAELPKVISDLFSSLDALLSGSGS